MVKTQPWKASFHLPEILKGWLVTYPPFGSKKQMAGFRKSLSSLVNTHQKIMGLSSSLRFIFVDRVYPLLNQNDA